MGPGQALPVDEEQLEQLLRNPQAHVTIRQQYSGPVPPSGEMERYDRLLPGSAERMLRMAEKGLDHQIRVADRESRLEHAHVTVGQVFGLIVVLAVMYASYQLVMHGHAVSGTIFGSLDLVALVTVFAYDKGGSDEKDEKKQKR